MKSWRVHCFSPQQEPVKVEIYGKFTNLWGKRIDLLRELDREMKQGCVEEEQPTQIPTVAQRSWEIQAATEIKLCGAIEQYKGDIHDRLSDSQQTEALFSEKASLNYVWIQKGEERVHGVAMPREDLGWVWNFPVSTTGFSDYVGYFIVGGNACAVEDQVYASSR